LGVKLNLIAKGGAWFSYGDIRLGQGRDNAKDFLRQNKAISDELEAMIRENATKVIQISKNAPLKVTIATDAPVEREATTKVSARAKLDIAVDDDE
jgi:recombination protein RecA